MGEAQLLALHDVFVAALDSADPTHAIGLVLDEFKIVRASDVTHMDMDMHVRCFRVPTVMTRMTAFDCICWVFCIF